ncbi:MULTISPECIES: MarR family transcriptional regulator [unclassified Clostridium]|uniref:Transcriptional regulator, MarR family n=1 Tax=Clostridium botulinum (strain Eklund 17B / Type B) TaxID=935198 RepID=B2TPI3_CLOBB|nr:MULTISPECIES: MarR family transcriptional regulator [unclassified Clostridium]ACD22748.1 transcriptional regulator, MarR family [Clostridium botulinum B str. Eklund 17B (NRP)]MBN1046386.1 MarR family transcriptional regulator [Clostridium botulinum]MBN1053090.1 MarR family transcriptional regulator [Clostridium botulinum]MBN1056285.1 MarR family transcriptional regulator [Clostridium botulinum]MBN1068789.1 MarR family transcriptional regulator [Clostridium botulinum]
MKDTDTLEILNELMDLSVFMKKMIIRPIETNSVVNISGLQMHTLCVLDKFNSINMTNLAKELMITKQQTTGIVNNLVNKGYINREVNPDNRKEILLSITESGNDTINTIKNHMTDKLYKYFNVLGYEDKRNIIESSKTIKETIKKIEKNNL